MAIKFVDENDLTAVANAIRAKTGESDLLMFPEEMAAAIGEIGAEPDGFTEHLADQVRHIMGGLSSNTRLNLVRAYTI